MPGESVSTPERRKSRSENGSDGIGPLAVVAAGVLAGVVAGIGGYLWGRNSQEPLSHSQRPENRSARRVPSTAPSRRPFPVPDDDNAEDFPTTPKQCCICFKNFDFIKSKGGEVHVTPCGHLFCHCCIYETLSRSNRCPTCRCKVEREETRQVFL